MMNSMPSTAQPSLVRPAPYRADDTSSAIARMVETLLRWRSRRTAPGLLDLDDRMLRDIGLTRQQVFAESNKWPWQR